MCNMVLLLFGKKLQRNLYVNCHVNGTTFQSGLRFQTGLSSLRVSCKRALIPVWLRLLVYHLNCLCKLFCSLYNFVWFKVINFHLVFSTSFPRKLLQIDCKILFCSSFYLKKENGLIKTELVFKYVVFFHYLYPIYNI